MKITKLEKKKRLFQLETDTDQIIYITEDTIVHFLLSKGKTISDEEFQAIQNYAQFSYGKNLALYYISFKPRTKKEVETYLEEHEIDKLAVPKIIKNLLEENWINDKNYAETYINQNIRTGDKGPKVLQQKLQQKEINLTIIKEIIDNTDFSQQAEKVSQKLTKKYQNKLPIKALSNKIKQSMYNKGFTSQQITAAINQLDIQKDSEEEITLLYKQIDKILPRYQKKYEGYRLKQALTSNLARKGYTFDDINSALREYLD